MDEELVILRAGAVWAGKGRFFAPGVIVLGKVESGGRRVLFVGEVEEARREFVGAVEEDWGKCLLMPGMVNAHCHLELSYLRGELEGVRGGELPGECFVRWVKAMWGRRPSVEELGSLVTAAVKDGLKESLQFGVTVIGDITRHVALSRGAAEMGPVRVVSFGEVIQIGARYKGPSGTMAVITEIRKERNFSTLGISPHAPYTVDAAVLGSLVGLARMAELPMMMHLAELEEEREFLATLGGPLRELWNKDGKAEEILDETIWRCAEGPVVWAKESALLDKTLHKSRSAKRADGTARHVGAIVLAHCNYLGDEDMGIIAESGASVVVCPRTRAFFGHPPAKHRFRELMEMGVNVCLGTDSLASNPDLSVLREARALWEEYPEMAAEELMGMVTWRGARALGIDGGELVEGGRGDLVAMRMSGASSIEEVLGNVIRNGEVPEAVWVGGERG